MILTIEKLKTMNQGIFATGTGTYPEIYHEEIRWVAVRGEIHDWCIYYHRVNMTTEFIARQGDKMFTEAVIKRLVPCNEEAYSMYRK